MRQISPNSKAADPPATDGLDDNILSLVHVMSNRIGRAFYGQVEAKHDVTLAEWRVIMTLVHQPGATAIDITNRWAMDKMAVSRAIRRLERMGRIRRSRNPSDRRSFALELTNKGRRLYSRIVPVADARYHELLACLSKRETAALRRMLTRLIGHAATLPD